MTGYKRVNYYELCRLCTSSQPKDKIHIFREEGRKMQLQQKIQSCFPLLVCEHDYLPKVVCAPCIQQLDQCFTFRQNCVSSETMLSSYFSNFRHTDDFKKAGKVYVKDTGQRELTNMNSLKKNSQENNINQQNISVDPNQQFFTLELPTISNKMQNIPKISVPNAQNVLKLPDYAMNPSQNVNVPAKPTEIKYNSPGTQQNLIPCNVNPINFNGNISCPTPKPFEQKNNMDAQQVDLNALNAKLSQPMVFIDVEQLIESRITETEVSKLKDILMKSNDKVKCIKKPKEGSLEESVLNSLNDLTDKNECRNKNFKCDICDKVFKRREHLYQHSKLHSGVRPFNCINCSKTFSRKEHLMRHLTSHSGVKDYLCDICNKRFSRPDNLKKHKKTHQKTGPYVCEICHKSFVVKHYFIVHTMQHGNAESINNLLKLENSDL